MGASESGTGAYSASSWARWNILGPFLLCRFSGCTCCAGRVAVLLRSMGLRGILGGEWNGYGMVFFKVNFWYRVMLPWRTRLGCLHRIDTTRATAKIIAYIQNID